ncbi:uncharacterized protein LOC131287231 [Anopheles ziemanni]|uniref:uncharacterized protein LOC131272768 n=1 Tax=Anopheles coustani TaxID=139045 RepID=UPI00265983FE|nr:uncharacterized protein LOC131272768 [Anopheles coustani]XP_058172247.1 uncharacterized protein LOC131287231 [Anopheles ziemanni]
MNFVLPGANVKMLARTVNCFSKIGNELFFEATPDGLELKTINATNTAYAVAQFKQDFFISFQQGNADTPDENCCKISVKPILKIFKSLSTIQTCKIWLDIDHSKIIFQFRCKSEVLKTHKIFLLESEHINSLNLSQTFPSEIIANHKAFSNMLLHLHHSIDEITFDLKEDKAIVSNFVDNEQSDRSTLRSALTVDTNTFQLYKLDQKASLTFCYKEFKAITMFASFTRLDIQMSFSQAGSPLMIQMNKSGVVQLKVILGTMQPSPHLYNRRAHRRNDSKRNTANRSVQMDSEAINTLLTEDITHNTETSQDVTNSAIRLTGNDSDAKANFPGRNNSLVSSNVKARRTVQDVVNEKLHEDSTVARSSRSAVPVQLNSVLDRQHQSTGKTTLNNEPSSETLFNTNSENFPFLEGINLPTANGNDLNSLASVPVATGTYGKAKETSHPVEIASTVSDDDLCELGEPISASIFSRKRNATEKSPPERDQRPKKSCSNPTPEIVPESPEVIEERKRKQAKLRHIFRRCFEPTFDPALQPGCSQIFAANSDSDGEF